MNILVVLATYYPHCGGISSHICILTRKLKEKNHNVYIYTLSSLPAPTRRGIAALQLFFDSVKKGLGDLVRAIAFKLLSNVIIFFYCIAKDIDIIHAHDCIAQDSVWLAKRLLKVPTVLTVHGYYIMEKIAHMELSEKSSLLIKLLLNLEMKSYKSADQLITVDSRLKKYVLTFKINESKITKIENFVDPEEWKVELDRLSCRKMFNLPNDKNIILVPRRLVKKCGVLLPLYALHHLPEQIRKDLLIVYCGTGPMAKDIKEYAEINGFMNVVLLGAVPHDKMKYIYKASDIVLIPSTHVKGVEEATSISALEAMAAGVPVIASNIGGLKEIILDHINGILVKPEPKSIADAIITLLVNVKTYNRIQAQQFVKNGLIMNIDKILSVYIRALSKKFKL